MSRAVVTLLLSILPTATPSISQSLPSIVQSEFQRMKNPCTSGKYHLNKGFIAMKDINGDGIPDYILSYDYMQCGEIAHPSCGSGGCTIQVFISKNDGFVKAYDEQAYDVTFSNVGIRHAMVVGLHRMYCDGRETTPCRKTLYLKDNKFSMR